MISRIKRIMELLKAFWVTLLIIMLFIIVTSVTMIKAYEREVEREEARKEIEIGFQTLIDDNWVLKDALEVAHAEIAEKDKLIELRDKEIDSIGSMIESLKKEQKDKLDGSKYIQTKEMTIEATAYTAYCNGCSGTTFTGDNLRENPSKKVIAVDPSVIPLGSLVYIESDSNLVGGFYRASDTGGAIKGNIIDIFIPEKEDAYKFGRRDVKIQVLKEIQ